MFINRIGKHIVNDEFNLEKTTYYVLDATGNVMATYDKEIDYINSEVYFKLKDRSIYGSSRVGVRSTDIDMLALHNPNYSMKSVKYEIGKRTYELSNHLGNVLSVISDKPIPSFEHEELAGMLADVRVAQDYSPFGVTLSGRDFMLEGAERGKYGFNGMEADNEVKGPGNSYDFGARMYDSRLGRWLTIDPLAFKFPDISPYAYCINNPILFIDPNGEEPSPSAYKSAAKKLGVSVAHIRAVYKTEVAGSAFLSDGKTKILFERHYFHRLTEGKYDKSNPTISNSQQGGYGLFKQQYDKLTEAKNLDIKAALMSVSWGGFQIMGANYKAAGFESVEEMAKVMMSTDENGHLEAFVNFIKNNKAMNDALKEEDWATFAKKYNGPNYKENNYDSKMKVNYEDLKDDPLNGLAEPMKMPKPQEARIELPLPNETKATIRDKTTVVIPPSKPIPTRPSF